MNNQILIVFDSLRWDVFQSSHTPFLNSLGKWKKAFSQGMYTLPAHISFFAGKLPQTMDNTDFYDVAASRISSKGNTLRNVQFWRLSNPEASRPSLYELDGENIIAGFRKQGYLTIGTGAVNWFNPQLPAGKLLTDSFEKFKFFDGPANRSHESAEDQIEWIIDELNKNTRPYFLFINFGETHHRFVYKDCDWHDDRNPYGDREKCFNRQKSCIEYLDKIVKMLFYNLVNYDLIMCSDHGEAMGENGLWGHGFFHKKVIEVPLLIKPNTNNIPTKRLEKPNRFKKVIGKFFKT